MCVVGICVGLLVPLSIGAQVRISEILYDPEGSDAKREWVEVFNSGSDSVDLATYFLLENAVYHKLIAQSGSILEAGAYAIIADSVPDVLADHPDFTGLIFDSAFSLTNTGETIGIANAQKVIVDEFTYAASMGAAGDGQSIQITEDTVVHAGMTFGLENRTVSEDVESDDTASTTPGGSSGSSSGGDSSHSQPEPKETYVPSGSFKIGAGRDRLVLINTPIVFHAALSKPEASPSFRWNLGDFTERSGRKVVHTYHYPGTYQVVLEGKNRDHTAVSRTEVTVHALQLEVVQATTTLSFTNRLSDEVNLGGFRMNFMGNRRRIPENTIIRAGGTLTIHRSPEELLVSMEYPNGTVYQRFGLRTDLVPLLAEACGRERPPIVCKNEQIQQVLVQ
jgi:hypothetical protein